MLRGIKPTKIEKRLKAFFFGDAGVGKTTAAIQFPKPYLIDTEKGAENDSYVELLDKAGGVIFQTCDFDEVINEVKALLTTKHEFKTLVIDPMTTLYNDLLDKSASYIKSRAKEKDADGTEFGRHYALANKKMRHLLNLLMRLDMNVIITSHAKKEYGDKLTILGETFDCYKKMNYFFDVMFQIQKRGKKRVGIVRKTRMQESFPEDDNIEFSYKEISNRYGKEILERDAVAQVLATVEQVNEMNKLVTLLGIEPTTVEKWLTKAESETFEEMDTDSIQKCIDYLKSKINT